MADPPHQFSKLAEDLSAVLGELLTKHQIGRPSAEQTIRDHWVEIVGAANAGYSHAATIERNRLVVLASHSVVRNELFHHREAIVARIRALPGCATIKSLNLRSG